MPTKRTNRSTDWLIRASQFIRGSRFAGATVCCCAVPISMMGSSAAEDIPRSVLILNQSGAGFPNTGYTEISSSFRTTLSAHSPLRMYVENLDFGNFRGPGYEATLQSYLVNKYRDLPIGVLVPVGSLALKFALELRSSRMTDAPIVFAAVDEDTVAKLVTDPEVTNITGRTLHFSLQSSIVAARSVVPDLKQIVLVGDKLTEQPFRRHFLDELPRAGENVSLVDVTGLPLSELMQRLAALPADAAILYTAITTDGLGTDYLPVDALKILAERTNRPIIFDVENRLGYGGTGGFVLVPRMAGQEAAQLALQLFSGEKASTIPITTSSAMKLVFDGRELDRWKVDEGRLPAGSEIRNRPISTWNEYRIQVIAVCAALLLQGTLISWLLVEHHYRRAAETEARDTMAELAHLNRIATAGELSASIAHEVSQPLTGIVTRANAALNWLASETPNLGKARMALTQIVTAGHRAGEIVTSTRAMFKKEAKHETEININDLVSAVMPLARIEARKYHIAVQEQLGDSLPTTTGNDVQLQQLILNLLMNAINSLRSAPGRRLVRVITENGHPGGLHVSIEDTGSGIRPSDVDQIFKPLFTTKPHGMGMGLAICRSIVKSHHGRIWASAAGERGSVFHFTLPANGHEG